MPLFEPVELTTQTAWIAGVKFFDEQHFHVQVVVSLKKKQKLWDIWSKCPLPCQYFFMEIQLPWELPPDIAPF